MTESFAPSVDQCRGGASGSISLEGCDAEGVTSFRGHVISDAGVGEKTRGEEFAKWECESIHPLFLVREGVIRVSGRFHIHDKRS